MQHIKPMGKGDPLCPLGFHPQVRWPTRCKRCFRDYKEHGNRNKDNDYKLKRNDTTASSPTLSSWNSKSSEEKNNGAIGTRSWTSTSNLNTDSNQKNHQINSNASSWTSTPDLDKLSDSAKANVETTASITLPRRRPQSNDNSEDDYRRTQYTVRRRTSPNLISKPPIPTPTVENKTSKNEVNLVNNTNSNEIKNDSARDDAESDIFTDAASTIHTDDTETIVNSDILQEQIESLKLELAGMKMRCEKAEKEKNDMLLRRVASLDNSMSTKTTSSELSKLQEKINNLNETCEQLKEEKKTLLNRIQQLDNNKKSYKSGNGDSEIELLKSKLQAAESLCEELMDENEEMKRELKDMEDEIEEMQDNFRENQADEYSSIKKELEQTGKNCRILSFKLRKAERKVEQLEADKFESERKSREAILKLQKELEEVTEKLKVSSTDDTKKKAPMLGNIPKTPSGEKVSRASLTRGGSQEDPAQLLRDLQDSIEREADLREQLRYAEEEAQNLRKKVSRVEDDNESLLMQLKKMATKAKSRKSSPTHSRLNPELSGEKDEGISDDDDPTELRLLLELNEQETAVLRKKVEELEENCDILKRKASDLQDKLLTKEQKAFPVGKRESSKILEAEIADLKNKLLERERECKQLDSELSLMKKKSKNLQKTRSLDGDQSSIDLQRQLKIVEQEASVLRARLCSLEAENEQLQNANKQLTIAKISKKASTQSEADLKTKIASLEKQLTEARKLKSKESDQKGVTEIEELRRKIVELESENARLITNLKVLKEGNPEGIKELYSKRVPKIVSDTTPKTVLKTMVQELENEIQEILSCQERCLLQYKEKLEKESNSQDKKHLVLELEKTKQKLEKVLNEQKEEKLKFDKEKEKLQNEKKKLENARSKLEEVKNKENQQEREKLQSEIEDMKAQITRLNKELKSTKEKQQETNDQLSSAYTELEEKRKLLDRLKSEYESAQNTLKEDSKLKTEISEKKNKISDLEKKLQEIEEKSKKSERLVQVKKEKIMNLEKELENYKKENISKKASEQAERDKWTQKEKELTGSIGELNKQIKEFNDKIKEKDEKIKQLEESIKQKLLNNKNKDNSTATNARVSELETKLLSSENEIKALKDKLKLLENEKKEIEKAVASSNDLKAAVKTWKTNAENLQSDLETERAAVQQYKDEQMKQIQAKDSELKMLKKKILNIGDKKVNDIKKDYDTKLETFKKELEIKQKEYDELTTKYEQLEDEHVRIKSQMNLQKEQMQSQVLCAQRELATVQNELRTLRETYNSRQDNWIKEKLRLEEKIKELENSVSSNETFKLEYNKVKLSLEVKESELEKLHKEASQQRDQLEHMRKDNEELQRKLDDFDKVIKVQHNMVADASALETEITELKAKLHNEEKARKVEIAALKIRYENHVSAISTELKDVQAQVMRFKHERNKYKQLLENSQKTANETKSPHQSTSVTNSEEVEELRTQVATLEQQISCMEDELSEARIESSRLKTELVSERSAWDVRMSEMTSRINELEEERLFQSGRTKTAGLKTRMELAWQKEREEQNRLLQETSTLARDLRQTLFEVERERDKERLEMKRRLEQMKKNAEEEQEETKKKLHELQCDLLELRDAHAKLRTTNEKLRREKERMEREKDVIRQTSRPNATDYDQKKLNYILDLVSELSKTVPNTDKGLPPVPNRKQNSSRESSVELRNTSRESSISKEDPNASQQQILQRLFEATRQIKSNQNTYTPNFNRDVARKAFISRRPASTESDKTADVTSGLQRKGSLYRKCISLEQTAPTGEQQEQVIWRTDEDTDGSLTSFQSFDDSFNPRANLKYDQTFDSRLSGGSTHSEMLPSTLERKKKKGLLGKLKKFAKSSRSIDDDSDAFPLSSASQGNPGSNCSISSNIIPDPESVPKRDLKGRISDLFKKSDSRSNSMERSTTSSYEVVEVPGMYDKKITESQTLPRRSTPSSTKTDKQLVPPARAGATMPRNISQKKPKP